MHLQKLTSNNRVPSTHVFLLSSISGNRISIDFNHKKNPYNIKKSNLQTAEITDLTNFINNGMPHDLSSSIVNKRKRRSDNIPVLKSLIYLFNLKFTLLTCEILFD